MFCFNVICRQLNWFWLLCFSQATACPKWKFLYFSGILETKNFKRTANLFRNIYIYSQLGRSQPITVLHDRPAFSYVGQLRPIPYGHPCDLVYVARKIKKAVNTRNSWVDLYYIVVFCNLSISCFKRCLVSGDVMNFPYAFHGMCFMTSQILFSGVLRSKRTGCVRHVDRHRFAAKLPKNTQVKQQ